jgi:hypothetical protein
MNKSDYGARQTVKVKVRQGITLSDNYQRLQNKPKINGLELSENKTAKELSLLSIKIADYSDLEEGAKEAPFLLMLTVNSEPCKISLTEITKDKFQTADELSDDIPVGSYIFLKIYNSS